MTQIQTPLSSRPLRLAAVDLGSNSFHLLIVEVDNGHFTELEKCSQKVQLAAGLNDQGQLDEEVMMRALKCLEGFGTLIDEHRVDRLRVVGTSALRTAANSIDFMIRAEQCLGQRIETISGREEARLIYQGASTEWQNETDHCLVADIGGGSTEVIVGAGIRPLALESLEMGCVAYTRRFFGNGEISEATMQRAEQAALLELANITTHYRRLGWRRAIGTSGTIKAAAATLRAIHPHLKKGEITREGLTELRQHLISLGHLDQVSMSGLKSNRARVFPAGIAILNAIFKALKLEHMQHVNGALRDGVLLDLLSRDTRHDVRYTTIEEMQRQYQVDGQHAEHVAATALTMFDQLQTSWHLSSESRQLLEQAAMVHEIGLGVAHNRYHQHGSYLLAHSDMPGFSLPDQLALAWLVQAHRRQLPEPLPEHRAALPPAELMRLARLLRLAVVLCRTRDAADIWQPELRADSENLALIFSQSVPELLRQDMVLECQWQQGAGLPLTINTP
ncbi:Ppx/GppA phosphatase family protein [Kushneria phyllosphaerae]|uniref:Guanosine-5'-triphosphate,3'-diphosphate pyrophosphatase n=1 Tax=Kushneria phyllosphaerae TaxID=2100822 RepID=A0A2R8CMQ9_9GAMM|nr:Ppx/GppA phosphatase family protein [Kushneria phyllosphaerae]SPJ34188.1 Guanosine-5'-triphosphate,3'-diphosphate pyrophosphatase [Kushneria phyllosphaerae]